jgi:hypothetical protein
MGGDHHTCRRFYGDGVSVLVVTQSSIPCHVLLEELVEKGEVTWWYIHPKRLTLSPFCNRGVPLSQIHDAVFTKLKHQVCSSVVRRADLPVCLFVCRVSVVDLEDRVMLVVYTVLYAKPNPFFDKPSLHLPSLSLLTHPKHSLLDQSVAEKARNPSWCTRHLKKKSFALKLTRR